LIQVALRVIKIFKKIMIKVLTKAIMRVIIESEARENKKIEEDDLHEKFEKRRNENEKSLQESLQVRRRIWRAGGGLTSEKGHNR